MDEKPDQIIGHIEAQREELGRNLSELESKVRRSTDWRTYFEKNPMLILGASLGGGILLGTIVAGRGSDYRSRRRYSAGSGYVASSASEATLASTPAHTSSPSPASPQTAAQSSSTATKRPAGPATAIQKSRINETVDQVKAALIAFGIAKAKEFLTQAIPGFDRHLDEADRSKAEHRSTMSGSAYNYPGSHSAPQDFRSHTETQAGGRGTQSGSTEYGSQEPVGAGFTPSNPRQ